MGNGKGNRRLLRFLCKVDIVDIVDMYRIDEMMAARSAA